RPPRPRVADGAGARLRAARHHRRARPVPRQPLHRGAPGRGVLPAERELPPGAPPLPGGSELPPPGAPPGHLGPPAARRVGHVVPRLPGPLPPRHADAGRDAHRPRRACEDPGVTPRLTHAVWAAASLPEARAFRRALGDVEGSQRRLLARIVRAGARTAYGEAHGFGAIRTAEAFRRRVPLVEYDAPGSNPGRALAPFVDRIAAGERRVLTAEPVRLLEPTSGSTAATKLIPYTAALQRDLRRAIAPWMADLYTRHPGVGRGPHYWALSPVARAGRHTEAGVPIGFEDDGAYLGAMGRLARATFAVPPEARHVSDLDAWRYVTLRLLVARRDLALVSVWSPT